MVTLGGWFEPLQTLALIAVLQRFDGGEVSGTLGCQAPPCPSPRAAARHCHNNITTLILFAHELNLYSKLRK